MWKPQFLISIMLLLCVVSITHAEEKTQSPTTSSDNEKSINNESQIDITDGTDLCARVG